VICPENQEIIPAVSAVKNKDGSMTSKPIEDMYPFLERDEFLNEMNIKPI
jgi:acetolactate synthase-1/2/3 large subunit